MLANSKAPFSVLREPRQYQVQTLARNLVPVQVGGWGKVNQIAS